MSSNNGKTSIPIIFEKSKHYKSFPATGAYGGISPQGEFICHFFVEYESLPDDLTIEIDEDKGSIEEKKGGGKKFTRELQCTMVLRPDIAKKIGEWLINGVENIPSSPTSQKEGKQ